MGLFGGHYRRLYETERDEKAAVEAERDACRAKLAKLKVEYEELQEELDEARGVAGRAALMLGELAAEALEGTDFPEPDEEEQGGTEEDH